MERRVPIATLARIVVFLVACAVLLSACGSSDTSSPSVGTVVFGTSMDKNRTVGDRTDTFTPSQPIFIEASLQQKVKASTIRLRILQNGRVIIDAPAFTPTDANYIQLVSENSGISFNLLRSRGGTAGQYTVMYLSNGFVMAKGSFIIG